jgi:hypothetical protein
MPKIKYVISKLEKAGFKVSESEFRAGTYYASKSARDLGVTVRFHVSGGTNDETHSFYVKRDDMDDDIQTDYWAGSWADNVTQAIASVAWQLEAADKAYDDHAAGTCPGQTASDWGLGPCRYCYREHDSGQCVGPCYGCQMVVKQIALEMGKEVTS